MIARLILRKYFYSSKNLSQSANGFTLVELLIVVAIIAILAAVGLTVYGNLQNDARDSRRRSDIIAIADAITARYDSNAGTYPVFNVNWFSSGVTPRDPNPNRLYCATSTTTTAALLPDPAAWITTNCPASSPGVGQIAWGPVDTNRLPADIIRWRVCATLENGGIPQLFCRSNVR